MNLVNLGYLLTDDRLKGNDSTLLVIVSRLIQCLFSEIIHILNSDIMAICAPFKFALWGATAFAPRPCYA